MSFELYASDFSNRYEITHAISVQMSQYYNDIGKLTLVVPVDDYNIKAVKNNSVLYDTDTGASFIVKNVKTDPSKNRITANGYTCNWLLNKRAVTSRTAVGTVESGLYGVVMANLRSLGNVTVAAEKGYTETTEAVLYGGQLLDSVMPVLTEVGLGQRMAWNPDTLTHEWEIYKGRDLTSGIHAVVFSTERGSANDLIISDDTSTFKNFVYVPGELQDGSQIVVEVGTATGEDRHEKWITTVKKQTNDETEAEFRTRLAVAGREELDKLIRRQSFSVTVDPIDYGTAYNLGDVVACSSIRYGVEFTARINGVQYTLDANGKKTSLILGEPTLTILGEARLNG